MKKAHLFIPVGLLTVLLSFAIIDHTPAAPVAFGRHAVEENDEDTSKKSKRVIDKRLAIGPIQQSYAVQQTVLEAYGE